MARSGWHHTSEAKRAISRATRAQVRDRAFCELVSEGMRRWHAERRRDRATPIPASGLRADAGAVVPARLVIPEIVEHGRQPIEHNVSSQPQELNSPSFTQSVSGQ